MPRSRFEVGLELISPADGTPPQLLMIGRPSAFESACGPPPRGLADTR